MRNVTIKTNHPVAKHIKAIEKIKNKITLISVGKEYEGGLLHLNKAMLFFFDKVLKTDMNKNENQSKKEIKKPLFDSFVTKHEKDPFEG